MSLSFYNGVSAFKTYQSAIDIWGDNIANINTPAFKENIPEFSTLFAETNLNSEVTSDNGFGSILDSTRRDYSIGSLVDSDNPFDIALGNEGWLAVKYGDNIYYTRNGSFTRDRDGFLVNDKGAYLIVANADNLKPINGGYMIDSNINTDDLIKTGNFSPISLPDNVILPAVATKNVTIKANLTDETHLQNLTPATDDLYFSALYDKDGNDLKMRDGDSFAYVLGDNITYNNSLFKKEICINDDVADNQDLIYDFYVNSQHIQATIPDGATKEEIINILANKLNEAGIQYETTPNSIIIESPDKLVVKSNNNLVKDAAGFKFVYKNDATNPYEFNTMQSFADNLQNALNTLYPNVTVGVNNGKIVINNPDYTINTQFLPTENSNELFLNNLTSLSTLKVGENSSFEFNANQKSLGGEIYEAQGDKDTLSFKFTKKEVLNNNVIWKAEVSVIKNNETISNNTYDFTFDDQGHLISPTQINLSSPQPIIIKTDLTSFNSVDNKISYSFIQDGVAKGYLKSYEITQKGDIFANFSNERSVKVATIPIYHFVNDEGLESMGDSLFRESANSNKAFLYENNGEYIPGANVYSHKLETSNVNFAQAMTELIVNQKAFSAAAKTVTTSDQMIQKAINMKR